MRDKSPGLDKGVKTTLAYSQRHQRDGVADTIAAPAPVETAGSPVAAAPATARSTVLPRVAAGSATRELVLEGRPRYEVVRTLGQGAQGEVTLARDHDIDRTVAVKRLRSDDDDGAILRFAEEVRTVGQLEHPNIVPIHDVGIDENGQYFFVMKYVDGETLETIIERLRAGDAAYERRYTFEYRAQIANEILRAVEHAHAHGILHRDLKPANIMIGTRGEVVVMDWGLAKRAADALTTTAPSVALPSSGSRLFETQAGGLVGTPAYMSPEQALGKLDEVDARSDIYSLAVIFYELFSLRHPRAAHTSVAAMVAAVATEDLSALGVLADFSRVGAPAALAHFVRHALERDPARRYQTVAAMRARLDAVRDGKAPVECHVTFTKRVLSGIGRAADRHPYALLVGLMAAAASALGGAGVMLWSFVH